MDYVINWAEALHAFLGVVLFLTASWVMGYLLLRRYIPGKLTPFKLFLTLASGMTMIVSLYAIVKTHGKTVLLPVPILLFASLFFFRKDTLQKEEPQGTTFFSWQRLMLILLGFSALYFTFFLQVYLGGDKNTFSYPGIDNLFYARVIDHLNAFGIENNLGDFFYPHQTGIKPYHYFDLWIAAFISQVMSLKSINALVLCSYTIFCTLTSLGIIALIQLLFKSAKNSTLLVIGALTPLFSGFAIFFPTFVLNADVFAFSIANYPKVGLIAIFLLIMLISAIKASWNSFLIFGSIISLLFINSLPGIAIACTLCIIVYVIFIKETTIKRVIPGIIIFFSSLIFIPFFYSFFSIKLASNTGSASYSEAIYAITNIKNLKTAVNIFIGGNFQFFILLPFIVLAVIILLKRHQFQVKRLLNFHEYKAVIVLFLFPISGLISWAALFNVSGDSVQFFHNLLIPFSGISIALVIAYCMQAGNYFRYIAAILVLIMCIINYKYRGHVVISGKDEWQTLKSYVKGQNNLMANYRGDKDFNTVYSMNVLVYQPLDILYYIVPNYTNTCLTKIKVSEPSIYTAQMTELQKQAPIYRFAQISDHTDDSSNEIRDLDFIRHFKINYISVSKNGVLPDSLKPAVKDSLILSSGWKLYQLRNNDNLR